MDMFSQSVLLIFVAPAAIGIALGYALSRRKPKFEDLSWRKEPTLGTFTPTDVDLSVDHLGRKEPTL